MPPTKEDVQSLVFSLFTLTAGLDRARRERKGASTLSLLQVVDQQGAVRPTEIASVLQVHPSLVTRQLRELEDAGYTEVTGHPADGRAWLVTLTPSGRDELSRLQQVGLDRFALFTADWEAGEVQVLAALLEKLKSSMADVGGRERLPARRRERVRARAPPPARAARRRTTRKEAASHDRTRHPH